MAANSIPKKYHEQQERSAELFSLKSPTHSAGKNASSTPSRRPKASESRIWLLNLRLTEAERTARQFDCEEAINSTIIPTWNCYILSEQLFPWTTTSPLRGANPRIIAVQQAWVVLPPIQTFCSWWWWWWCWMVVKVSFEYGEKKEYPKHATQHMDRPVGVLSALSCVNNV